MKRTANTLKPTILILLLLSAPAGYTQITSPRSINERLDAMLEKGSVISDVNYDNIEGSPYVNSEFLPGSLTMKNGRIYENVLFRYNIYTDQVEFRDGQEILAFALPNDLEKVHFDGRTFIYGNFYHKDRLQKGYYQLLADGKCKLLLRRTSVLKREQLPATEFTGGNFRDYFRDEEVYYITRDGRELILVRNNAKSLIKALGDKKQELETFIREGNLDLKKDEDFGEVVFYYNQISK